LGTPVNVVAMTTQQPIYIVGAGTAGLTLGRCLKSKGISTTIFERGDASTRHNYGITLHPWAYQPLLQYFSIDESTFRKRLVIGSLNHGNGIILSGSKDELSFRAHCGRFEDLLRDGLDIKWNHTLEEISGSGTNRELVFSEGARIHSTITIDSCGVHTKTR